MPIKAIMLILLLAGNALAAEWVEIQLKQNWDRTSKGMCKTQTQCLVNNAYNELNDNRPEKYWETKNDEKPKCIENGQYITDHYCENGNWGSRTKLVAAQLAGIGRADYSLYCDSYTEALNRYEYETEYGEAIEFLQNCKPETCVNNICVMKYNAGIAFGMALNGDVSGERSPLQALGLNKEECNEAKNNDEDYDDCGENVWYNHNLKTILYLPEVSSLMPEDRQAITEPYEKIKNYVFAKIHNPLLSRLDYSFYNTLPEFNQLQITKKDGKIFYGFKQKNVAKNLVPIEYAGWHFSHAQLPAKACERFVKAYDSRANCEEQTRELNAAAFKTKDDARTGLTDAWQDVAGRLKTQ